MNFETGSIDPFRENGFVHFKEFFSSEQMINIRTIVHEAQSHWERENIQFMKKGAINSAYLTSPRYCRSESARISFFQFIAMSQMVDLAYKIMDRQPYFMNTQVFFNPIDKAKKPYWHRDIQYSGLPEDTQKVQIFQDEVLHFRIPLSEDPGLEFIPGSHKRWDTEEERKVRLELDGRKNFEPLAGSIQIPHAPKDLLVFSAHLIHKGIYSGSRLSLDILFASFKQGRDSVKETGHFPSQEILSGMKNKQIFDLK